MSSARRVGLVPVSMAWTRSGEGGPKSDLSGRPPSERISAARRIRHQPDGAVLDPAGLVGGGAIRLAFLARDLDAQQQRSRTPRLAHHAGGLGGAFQDEVWVTWVFAGQSQAFHRLGVGGHILGGQRHLLGICGQQRGNLGDGGVVAAGEVFGGVGHRWRERGGERVDGLVVEVAGKLKGEVGRFGRGTVVHGGSIALVMLPSNVIMDIQRRPCSWLHLN